VSNRTNKPPADNKSIIVEEIIYIKREIERDRASTTTTRRERERAKKNNANEARRNWTSPCGTFLMLITRRLLPYVFITHTHTHTHGHIITSTIHITHQIPKEDQRKEEKKSRARYTTPAAASRSSSAASSSSSRQSSSSASSRRPGCTFSARTSIC